MPNRKHTESTEHLEQPGLDAETKSQGRGRFQQVVREGLSEEVC